jgi:hypothetical protein
MLYEIQLSVSYLSDQFRREKVDLPASDAPPRMN